MFMTPRTRWATSCIAIVLGVAVGVHGAHAKKPATRPIPPKVWFFISDPDGLDYSERVGNFIGMGLSTENRKLMRDAETADLAVRMTRIVCPLDQVEDKVERAVQDAWLTDAEKREGRRAVFILCRGVVHEPDKRKHRAKKGEAYRFQVDLEVEAESYSLMPSNKGVRRRRRWHEDFETTYISPRQTELAPGQQPETARRAVQKACEKFAKEFFEYRDEWMKIKRKRK